MIPPAGDYRYETRHERELFAVEESRLEPLSLSGVRRAADGTSRHEVKAVLDPEGFTRRIELRYSRGPFSRSAVYEAGEDLLRGSLSTLGGASAVETKLGRFGEIDGDLLLFKALIVAHIRARGQARWTGRVATIDPATLIAASPKQTWRRCDAEGWLWSFEPLIGESEEIELDAQGRIVRRADRRGFETRLVSFA